MSDFNRGPRSGRGGYGDFGQGRGRGRGNNRGRGGGQGYGGRGGGRGYGGGGGGRGGGHRNYGGGGRDFGGRGGGRGFGGPGGGNRGRGRGFHADSGSRPSNFSSGGGAFIGWDDFLSYETPNDSSNKKAVLKKFYAKHPDNNMSKNDIITWRADNYNHSWKNLGIWRGSKIAIFLLNLENSNLPEVLKRVSSVIAHEIFGTKASRSFKLIFFPIFFTAISDKIGEILPLFRSHPKNFFPTVIITFPYNLFRKI